MSSGNYNTRLLRCPLPPPPSALLIHLTEVFEGLQFAIKSCWSYFLHLHSGKQNETHSVQRRVFWRTFSIACCQMTFTRDVEGKPT